MKYLITIILCIFTIYQSFSQPFTKIRVAVNFIVDENGSDAFTELGCNLNDQSSCPNPDYNAFDFAKDMINKSNALLSCNAPSNLGEYNQEENGWIFKTDQSNLYGEWYDPNFEMPPKIDIPFRYELARVNVYYRDCTSDNSCLTEFVSGSIEDQLYADEMDASKMEFPVFIFTDGIIPTWYWNWDQYAVGALSYVFGDKSGCNLDYANLLNHEIGHQLALLHQNDTNNYQDPDGNVDNDASALEPCYALELYLKNQQAAGFNMDNYYNSLAPYQQEKIDWCYNRKRHETNLNRHFEDGRNHSNDVGVNFDEHPNITQITTFHNSNFDIADFANNIIDAGVGWFYPLGYTPRNINRAVNELNGNSLRFSSDYPIVNINSPLNNAVLNDGLGNSTLRRIAGSDAVNVSSQIDLQDANSSTKTVIELISEKKVLFLPGTEIIPDENGYLCAYVDLADNFNSAEPVNYTDCAFDCNYHWEFEDYWNSRITVNQQEENETFSRMLEDNKGTICETCRLAIESKEKEELKIHSSEHYEDTHLLAYPDPFVDNLTIELHTKDMNNHALATLNLLDINGKTIVTLPFIQKTTISTENLPKGMYTLSIKTMDKIINKKITK